MEPAEIPPLFTVLDGLQPFYQYVPTLDGKTYCGALSRTGIDGQPWMSTFGGLVETDGIMYIHSCQHGSSVNSANVSVGHSLADTIGEEDLPDTVDPPLGFVSVPPSDGPNDESEPEATRINDALSNLGKS
jgi:hypothetical protein